MGKGKQFGYFCCYKSNFDHLTKEVEKLRERRESVQHRVDFAKENGEEIEQSVENWLISVDKIVEEAGKFVEDDEEANNPCFKGLCPNLKNRHQLSKKAAKEVKAIVELQDEGNFDRVSVRGISRDRLVAYTESYNEGHDFIESRESILNDILDALRGPYVSMIGVYGMAGIGKTTLVKEVARLAKEGRIFDEVVFAEVSQTPDLKRIRREIADQLGLNFCEESDSERIMMLCDRLKREKKILVILDDIWTSLDLERTGIPFGDVHRGCKILVTSRRRDVLVSEMHCQNNYCVSVLNKEEAWSLFSKVVGNCVEDPDLQTVAIQVANECGGLPIAILTVARTLRNKPLFVWKKALQELRFSARNFTGLEALLGSTIELIYNNLEGEELKLTFLLCSLMKHPCDAPIMDLLKYGTGLGLFEDIYTMQERRDRVYALVRGLKDNCLLHDDDTADWFSMLGFVRNVAISIASINLMVRNDALIEWPNKDMLKNCIAIFLHDINTGELPEGLEYPHLTSFCMNPKDPFLHIPDNFFADIAIIGNLKNLEILSLCCSDIEQLPREIGELTQLKLLDLSNCSKLKVIPPNVISSLSQLEELYLGNTSVEWEFEGLNLERNNASLQELSILSHLTTLEIHIRDAVILPKGLFSQKLARYKILVGDVWDWPGKSENTRTLKLKLPTNIYLDEIIMNLKEIEELYLDEVPGIENVLYELDRKGLPALKHLRAQNNPFILCIVDSMAQVRCNAFPVLESMFLHNLIHLEKICDGLLTAEFFSKLRIIKVRNCDKLKNIFSFSIVRGLPQLQILKVIKCNNMEEIFSFGGEDDVGYNEVDKIEFGQLRSLILKFLPQLTSFYAQLKSSDELDTPKPLFNERVVFPNLETLELYAINTERIWHNQPVAVSPGIRNLTRLIVHGSEKIKYLFPSSIVRNFVQLQHLEICHCTVLEEIVSKERGEEATATFVFPKVTYLKLCNLSELITFYPGIHTLEWPLLKRLEVYGCNKVKIFTSEFLSFPKNSEEIQRNIPTQQALFLVEKVGSHLEELKLSGKDITMIREGRLPTYLFQNLKILEVVNEKL
ncbi:hypothetical protein CICLE_v10018626mg [Citrus x clementina]|uniref:AAA+ ATPase domain-containing protein n=1 Tax=Citrus clementina TaxID=85681 RepID=V4TWF4_CITCL|nr:hypothetical protein CICLE_v10018626mg [Citrus x clementina]